MKFEGEKPARGLWEYNKKQNEKSRPWSRRKKVPVTPPTHYMGLWDLVLTTTQWIYRERD